MIKDSKFSYNSTHSKNNLPQNLRFFFQFELSKGENCKLKLVDLSKLRKSITGSSALRNSFVNILYP